MLFSQLSHSCMAQSWVQWHDDDAGNRSVPAHAKRATVQRCADAKATVQQRASARADEPPGRWPSAGGHLDFSQRTLRREALCSDGFSYDALRPGNHFFAALEAVVVDRAERKQRPLPLRLPPTIVFGPRLHCSEPCDPLWLWSDVAAGGGLRCMRRPLSQPESAALFLTSQEHCDALRIMENNFDISAVAKRGAQATSCSDGDIVLPRHRKLPSAAVREQQLAYVDRVLGSLVAVHKSDEGTAQGSQRVRLLSLRSLHTVLKEAKNGGAEPGRVDVLQRFVPPQGCASVLRVRHRDAPFLRGHSICAGEPLPSGVTAPGIGTNGAMTALPRALAR